LLPESRLLLGSDGEDERENREKNCKALHGASLLTLESTGFRRAAIPRG
jgi:hypothetical protein